MRLGARYGAPERLALRAALDAYTAGPAFAARADRRRGMITVGREVALVVLDRDLPGEDGGAIVGTRVVATVVGGRIFQRREGHG